LEVIKSSSEISTLFKEGRRVKTPDVIILVLRNEKQHDLSGRVAFVAGKKMGNAVWRNRAKRRMRSLCRDINAPYAGYDLVFLARSSVNEASYSKMLENVRKALKRAGVEG
jgi:ribonuclease P protein component